MKKIQLLFIACAAFVAMAGCGSKSHYVIEGEQAESELEGCLVYLYNEKTPIDSVVITDGAFRFEGETEEAVLLTLYTVNAEQTVGHSFPMVLEAGKISVRLDRDSVYGTPLNDAYNACLLRHDFKAKSDKSAEMYADIQQADPVSRQVLIEAYSRYEEEVMTPCFCETMTDLLESNKTNVWGVYAAKMMVYLHAIDYATLQPLMADTNSLFSKDARLQKMLESLKNIEATSVGLPYADFACILPNGQLGMVSELVNGKLTLLDFWASWCSPCRQEIEENLIRIANEYGKQGLQVIGVDVWDKPEKHAEAVAQMGIPYPQVIDTTRNATNIYGINSIPEILLIGPDGVILARGIRGFEIEEAVIEALNPTAQNPKK